MSKFLRNLTEGRISRRDFLKGSAAATAAVAALSLTGCESNLKDTKTTAPSETIPPSSEVDVVKQGVEFVDESLGKWIPAACWHNCGGRCLNKALVVDGVVIRQKTDDMHPDTPEYPQQRGCLRGRAQRQQCLGADRIKYPMKRKHWQPGGVDFHGELRGKDEWERITWEEAYDLAASEIKRIYDAYGVTGVLNAGYGTGQNARLLNALGGCINLWDTASHGTYMLNSPGLGLPHQGVGPGVTMCMSANDRFDLKNSETIVLYGCNPAWASLGSQCYYFMQAKESGTKFVYVGPSYNFSASLFDAKWIRVRPGTDVALLLAVAYEMLKLDEAEGNIVDWDFLKKYCVGFTLDTLPEGAKVQECFQDYVLGKYDGIPKTAEWAEPICGTPVEDIRWFAKEIGKEKKVALLHSFAAARNMGAEDFPQMFMTIGAMGGHYGKSGHSCGAAYHSMAGNGGASLVLPGSTGIQFSVSPIFYYVSASDVWNAVLDGYFMDTGMGSAGSAFGYHAPVRRDCDVHMIYHDDSGATLQSCLGIMKGIEAHRKVDFVLTHAYTMTTNAKYSDLILPAQTQWEKTSSFFNIIYSARDFQIFPSKVVEPLYEAKSDQEIISTLAQKVGLDPAVIYPFNETQQYFNQIATSTVMKEDNSGYELLVTITDVDIKEWGVEGTPQQGRIPIKELMEKGMYQVERYEGDPYFFIAYKDFVDDPENHPLPSASGKFEIYNDWKADILSQTGRGDTVFKPYPSYTVPKVGYESTFKNWDTQEKGDYPYLMYTPHYLRRSHTTLNNVPWLREAATNPVFLSAADAAEKDIQDGDTVLIYNEFGKILRNATVMESLMPGVVGIPHGSWVDIDEETGIDHGGADNVLCGPITSNSGVSGYNNYNVNFEKYTGTSLAPDHEWPQRIFNFE